MVKGTRQYWEHGQVALTSTSVPVKIAELHKGEAIWIKAKVTNGDSVYIGNDDHVSSSNGYILDQGEGIKLEFDPGSDTINFLEVWALPATADDVVTFYRIIDFKPWNKSQGDQ